MTSGSPDMHTTISDGNTLTPVCEALRAEVLTSRGESYNVAPKCPAPTSPCIECPIYRWLDGMGAHFQQSLGDGQNPGENVDYAQSALALKSAAFLATAKTFPYDNGYSPDKPPFEQAVALGEGLVNVMQRGLRTEKGGVTLGVAMEEARVADGVVYCIAHKRGGATVEGDMGTTVQPIELFPYADRPDGITPRPDCDNEQYI